MNRRILITGAGSGLGRGLAHLLGLHGNQIIVTDMNGEAAATVAQEVTQAGGSASSAALNVTQQGACESLLRDLGARAPEVLINNAGLQHVARLDAFDMDKWASLVEVMLTGAARVTRAVLPAMQAADFGRIINIGSIHSLVASPFKSAYVAAKHGLIGLSKTLALETAASNITVNTVCPSYVRTPLVDAQIAAQAREHGISEARVIDEIMLAPMPKKAFIAIEEIAAAVEYLMGDAARNVTGQTIVIDGGWTAR